jgi:hypothetical protein
LSGYRKLIPTEGFHVSRKRRNERCAKLAQFISPHDPCRSETDRVFLILDRLARKMGYTFQSNDEASVILRGFSIVIAIGGLAILILGVASSVTNKSNGAAVSQPQLKPVAEMTTDEWLQHEAIQTRINKGTY